MAKYAVIVLRVGDDVTRETVERTLDAAWSNGWDDLDFIVPPLRPGEEGNRIDAMFCAAVATDATLPLVLPHQS